MVLAMNPRLCFSIAFVFLSLGLGCSSEAPECSAGYELFEGSCVETLKRYEPRERADSNNVSAYGEALTELSLPEPPKRGFRLVAPPLTVAPGEEVLTCVAWPFPGQLSSSLIYGARLYTTPGLHHSNVVTRTIDPDLGPQPYPDCHPGAYDPFGNIPEVIPDVLFANSTQVVGHEDLTFPPGVGFRVDPSREIVTSIHFLNTGTSPMRIEVAYDFFTMPEEKLISEAAPFVMQVNDFLIPPHTKKTIELDCTVFGGYVTSLMPHTHKLLERFYVEENWVSGKREMIYEKGSFDFESDIRMFNPPRNLSDVASIRFGCDFNNTLDKDVVYGVGDNEMCILFGYIYPAEKQFIGYADYEGESCQSHQIGLFR